jgi:bacterioferritin-associated ferredoxin
MIVCMCHAVSDAELRELVRAGASESDVVRLTRAGTSCGCCASTVQSFVASRRPPCGKAVPCSDCACSSGADEERRAA